MARYCCVCQAVLIRTIIIMYTQRCRHNGRVLSFLSTLFRGWWVDDRILFVVFVFLQSIQYSFEMGCTIPWYLSFYVFLLFVFYFHGYYTNGRIEVLYQQSIEPCVAGISKSKYQKRKALNKQLGKLEWNDATTDSKRRTVLVVVDRRNKYCESV